MDKIRKLLTGCLLTLVTTIPIHAKTMASPADFESVAFDPVKANKQFDTISLSLTSPKLSIRKLSQAIEQLEILSEEAQDCVDDSSTKIKEIDEHLKAILGSEGDGRDKENTPLIKPDESHSRVDSQYLNQQKKKLIDIEAKCRLFQIRAGEALTAYRNTELSMQQKITFTRGLPIFKRVEMVHRDIQNLSTPKYRKPIIPWGWVNMAIFVLAIVMIVFGIVYGLRESLKTYVKRRSIGLTQVVLGSIALSLFTLWLMNYKPFMDGTDNMFFQSLLTHVLFVVLALLLTQFLFAIRRFDIGLKWYGFDPGYSSTLTQVIILISGIHLVGNSVLTLFESGQYLKQFFDSIMMMLSLLATTYFTYQFYLNHQRFFANGTQFTYIYRLIWLIVFTLIAFDLFGFYILAVDASDIFFSLLLVGGLSLVVLKGFGQAYHFLNYSPRSQAYLKRYFGYSSTPPYFELALLKVIIQISIAISLLYLFAYLIGEASYFIDYFLDYIFQGFVVASYTFKPLHWLIGILVFCMIVIISRYISRHYSLKTIHGEEEDTQVALASLILYIGFTMAVIMGLLVSGFSFTSLAIIAGALSVGIGLGLQSIVNNFFSGLILLIEKPIKVGDRIAIGDVEGFVKKVRVRSTQIETPSKEDIIVPNSDLITQQVTNFMFTNHTWRVKCTVGVAYGSDTELVKNVLLDVAKNHKDVLDSRGNKPMVLFQSFGDSALVFELWCMINNVNKKFVVTSDLNFAIDKAFRAHNIVIAFPQRDVHIKYEPPPANAPE
ncbi:mechanosensitive ion channel family protein [Legionella sp. W05-934-2]|jgi:small-conductance mechanosensitive channel|uniref:mechanosensitive ion channel family protein n=1 Tax=Legionella sp. W05-934-2 TaxID=1198649 RepID=UPI0034626D6D